MAAGPIGRADRIWTCDPLVESRPLQLVPNRSVEDGSSPYHAGPVVSRVPHGTRLVTTSTVGFWTVDGLTALARSVSPNAGARRAL